MKIDVVPQTAATLIVRNMKHEINLKSMEGARSFRVGGRLTHSELFNRFTWDVLTWQFQENFDFAQKVDNFQLSNFTALIALRAGARAVEMQLQYILTSWTFKFARRARMWMAYRFPFVNFLFLFTNSWCGLWFLNRPFLNSLNRTNAVWFVNSVVKISWPRGWSTNLFMWKCFTSHASNLVLYNNASNSKCTKCNARIFPNFHSSTKRATLLNDQVLKI